MRPPAYAWPTALVFWVVFIWAFFPEFGIVRRAHKSVRRQGAAGDGSLRILLLWMQFAYLAAFLLPLVPALRFPDRWQLPVFVGGLVLVAGGSLLRRHCFRMLGDSFTGDVQARADQEVVTAGAYAFLRHPSYAAGILMNTGFALALGSWAGVLVIVPVTVMTYRYRMVVEERVLADVIGEPYEEFMRTRKRFIPYIY